MEGVWLARDLTPAELELIFRTTVLVKDIEGRWWRCGGVDVDGLVFWSVEP